MFSYDRIDQIISPSYVLLKFNGGLSLRKRFMIIAVVMADTIFFHSCEILSVLSKIGIPLLPRMEVRKANASSCGVAFTVRHVLPPSYFLHFKPFLAISIWSTVQPFGPSKAGLLSSSRGKSPTS